LPRSALIRELLGKMLVSLAIIMEVHFGM
jgi:hypothetical protein